jgi:hypothetical protein
MYSQVYLLMILSIWFTGAKNLADAGHQGTTPMDDTERDTCAAYANQPLPHYRVANRFLKKEPVYIHLYVSVDRREITRAEMIALVCKLGQENAEADTLSIQVFDRFQVATKFGPNNEGDPAGADKSRRAIYIFSREPGEAHGQRLDWLPSNEREWKRIYLGPPPARPGQ